MSAQAETVPAYSEVEPIVRAYQDPEADEWIVDWNQAIDPNRLPLDMKPEIDKAAKIGRGVMRRVGIVFGSVMCTPLLMGPTPETVLAVTGGLAVIGTSTEIMGRSLAKTFAKDRLAQFGTHEQSEFRRVRIPEAVLVLDVTMTNESLYTSIKEKLLTAYEPNKPTSPLLVVDQTSKEEVVDAIPTMRINAFKKYFEINPDFIDVFGSEEALITAQLQNPERWYSMPDELVDELQAIAKLEQSYRLALVHQEKVSGAQESIAVLPSNIVRQTAQDPAALEFILPELLGYVEAFKAGLSTDHRTQHLASLATKIANHTQRQAITA